MMVGEGNVLIKVIDVGLRAILKIWNAHKPQPQWITMLNPANSAALISTGDDITIRLWDLPSKDPMTTFHSYTDYVCSGFVCSGFVLPNSSNMVASRSYNSIISVWDTRSPSRAIPIFKHHRHQIDCVLPTAPETGLPAYSSQSPKKGHEYLYSVSREAPRAGWP